MLKLAGVAPVFLSTWGDGCSLIVFSEEGSLSDYPAVSASFDLSRRTGASLILQAAVDLPVGDNGLLLWVQIG